MMDRILKLESMKSPQKNPFDVDPAKYAAWLRWGVRSADLSTDRRCLSRGKPLQQGKVPKNDSSLLILGAWVLRLHYIHFTPRCCTVFAHRMLHLARLNSSATPGNTRNGGIYVALAVDVPGILVGHRSTRGFEETGLYCGTCCSQYSLEIPVIDFG